MSVSPKESRAFTTSPASFDSTIINLYPLVRKNRTQDHLRKMGLERDLSRGRLQPHLYCPTKYYQIHCRSYKEW